jgi:MoxR-like ATPase
VARLRGRRGRARMMDTVQETARFNEAVREQSRFLAAVRAEIARVIVGQEYLISRLLISLLTNNHILIEGVPGLAKTLSIATLAATLDLSFVRVQFTPDMLPADLTGTTIYNARTAEFSVHQGPIFANLVLADEVNRAPAKVQSALLEAMQERQVSIGGQTFPLPEPFMVLATQNPIEQEGTYALPEAQLDRFMLKAVIGYPSRLEERAILDRGIAGEQPQVRRIVTPDIVLAARRTIRSIYIDERLKDYIIQIVSATRNPHAFRMDALAPLIGFGASPRATIFLAQAAQAHAFIDGRGYVTPDDIKAVAPDVLRHRIVLTYEAAAEEITADEIIRRVLAGVDVP